MMEKQNVLTAGISQLRGVIPIAVVFSQALIFGQPAAIQITSPITGSTVSTGQQFTVDVTTAPGVSFNSVIVIAQNFAVSAPLANSPFTFSFTAPSLAGLLTLTAVGTQGSGSAMFSQPVVVSVESSSTLSGLSINPAQIAFAFAGQHIPLIVTGKFADGTTGDITYSPLLTYTSSDTTVAQVASTGIVTAVGSGATGSTQITVTYGAQSEVVNVRVPKAIRGDLNNDGKVNEDDLNIILSALNTPATKPVDARDLNGDGVINALDARILVTLCTLPSCATH